MLIEGGREVLPSFPEELSDYTMRALEKLGVEVVLGQPVTACDAEGVTFGDTRLPADTIIWAAGVRASPAGQWVGAETDRAGRAKVGRT